jgi:DNA polymerase
MDFFHIRDLYAYGVRWELQDTPKNHLITPAPKKEISSIPNSPLGARVNAIIPDITPINPNAEAIVVREIAASAATCEDLCAAILNFENHPLKKFAKNTVLPKFAITPSSKKIAVIIDAPSIDDDAAGNILSGAAGEMFDKMMVAVGFMRENISIIPLLFWRAPGGRSPTETELEIVRPFFDRALELAAPDAILTFGSLSAATFGAKLSKEPGVFANYNDIVVAPMFGFDYMIMRPESKKITWETLQKLLKSWE